MKITEKEFKYIIKECLKEASDYSKSHKQYFPKYTGDAHKDAGSYQANGGDFNDMEYSRNNYQWQDADRKRKFDSLRPYDMEPDYTDPNEKGVENAKDYIESHDEDNIIKDARNALMGDFAKAIDSFMEKAKSRYPIFNDESHYREFIDYYIPDMLKAYDDYKNGYIDDDYWNYIR